MDKKLAIIGLGYVGLPLAVAFGNKYSVIGFDINTTRINELKNGIDKTLEVSTEKLKATQQLAFSDDVEAIRGADIYIITVPTPIDHSKQPDLTPLRKSSESIGKVLKKGDIVVYESTVFPGCTEEICVPILEAQSGLKYNEDFYCGYSPERINPGDKVHTVTKIKKVVSGSTPEVGQELNDLYASIITAGTYLASSIKVAEAAKVIENSQRDLNIAFVNELALIFDKLDIDTHDVLEAAGTKWNFLPFRPGLVGGHCIGVDPYYLTHKAESIGYNPQVILSGRRINDNMGQYVANKIIKLLIQGNFTIRESRVLILGFTFKENCPDTRNTRVIDVVKELKEFGVNVEVHDPHADKHEVMEEYGLDLIDQPDGQYEGIMLAVSHTEFENFPLSTYKKENAIVYDVKAFFNKEQVDARL
ncbi:nucleotide sugar dehydrogenase [Microscilla marina]|uniref:VI polysaccharide biosynthesis protein VipA/tviB n=1 Tax=Microscilla marina ATCC 23134 TaxID=313606 RepID=A1ZIA4_MICM2|nr:nucleotide sugar dehydrogenase [Microscilla marina]EAY29772.1 VI polysaccharide biosynthesis protein VipA/tviB [Microscilla marina ATCC 23134]